MSSYDLHPGEQLINTYRQTRWVLLKPAFVSLVFLYLPWHFLYSYDLHSRYQVGLLVWSFAVLAYFFNKWLVWFMNSYVLTDKRLITIHFRTIFHKSVVETPLERILNIGYETPGVFPSLLNFGDIQVQIMGVAEPIRLRHIRQPSGVKDFLWQVHSEHAGDAPQQLRENPGVFQPKLSQQVKNKKIV